MTGMRSSLFAFLLTILGIQECSAIDACIDPTEGATKCDSGEDWCEYHLDNNPSKSCLKYCHERGLVCQSACNDQDRCICEEGGSTPGDCYRTWSSALCRCSNNTELMPQPPPDTEECQLMSKDDHHVKYCNSSKEDDWCEYHQESQEEKSCDNTCRELGLACESSCNDGGTCDCGENGRSIENCYRDIVSKICRCSSDPILIEGVPTENPTKSPITKDPTPAPTKLPSLPPTKKATLEPTPAEPTTGTTPKKTEAPAVVKPDPLTSSSSGLSDGETTGVAIGAVVVALLLVFLAYYSFCRKDQRE